jgi:hypothetical protein
MRQAIAESEFRDAMMRELHELVEETAVAALAAVLRGTRDVPGDPYADVVVVASLGNDRARLRVSVRSRREVLWELQRTGEEGHAQAAETMAQAPGAQGARWLLVYEGGDVGVFSIVAPSADKRSTRIEQEARRR